MNAPDRRTALRAGLAVLGTAAASAGLAACSDGKAARTEPAASQGSGARAAGTAASPGPTSASAPGAGSASPSSRTQAQAQAQAEARAQDSARTQTQAFTEVDHAATGRAQVALTFHGDGDPQLAQSLLKEAEANDARLTVLAVGRWLGGNPEMARRVLDGGHELGNHTENHVDISSLSPTAAFAEIEACAARLRKLTGSPGIWFRPSQTQHANPMLVEQARRAGYRTVLSYDVDPLDYEDPSAAQITERLLAAVHPGAVVSMHLGHQHTVTALPAVLAGLKARGLAAVTTSELFS
ncbi:polysaccharide deacetylase family protein [Catenulispora sp. NF23]|uniref:Polysaccharide deacetylase family protein n=1 Tax=Catenulispora pinistramenti TaxID=2705254 RepID=A0ABS5KZZ7_9ACTN|nr:polysaccharide deacetylase family protein [Catenulispora pinistramenti]MBS2535037.1 polysaccharide deacetylase family protein [Catenulispora pinistramenti]MBS2551475.1 polysaccharide deacetylase family protein [Catenulispora pinistramenti]